MDDEVHFAAVPPPSLPSLLRAQRVGQQAAAVGFDWSCAQLVVDKIREEIEEVVEAMEQGTQQVFDELGDLLFATVNLARHLDLDAEDALRVAIDRFEQRFFIVEQLAKQEDRVLNDCDDDELDHFWERAKALCVDHQSPS